MWKALIDGALAFSSLVERMEAHRVAIHELERRVRDLEEAMRLSAQSHRHQEEIAAAEREKLLLRLEAELAKHPAALPAPRRKKSK